MRRQLRRFTIRIVVGIAIAWPCGATTLAHHSSAMYDTKKTVTLRGVVTQFRWTNPHVTMMIRTDTAGSHKGELWVVEATSPGNLSRDGWTRTAVHVDDRVEVIAAPLSDGGHGAFCRSVTLRDRGMKLEC
jgi:hypothetical protein